MADTHKGACFCGAVEIEVTGAPEAMGYCHCRSCRSWSAGPVNAFTLWKPDTVKITKGADKLAVFEKTEMSQRISKKSHNGYSTIKKHRTHLCHYHMYSTESI